MTKDAITELGSADRAGWMRAIEMAARRAMALWAKGRVAVNGGSLRVGSGSAALATLDGSDGFVSADGTAAAMAFRDRANAAQWAAWYENGSIRLYNGTSDLWQIDRVTGLVTQPALTALTAGTNVSLSATGFGTTGSLLVLPTGQVYVQLNLTATGAVAALAVVATTTTGHRPTSGTIGGFGATKFAGGVISAATATPCSVFINTGGGTNCSVALANTDTLISSFTFLPK